MENQETMVSLTSEKQMRERLSKILGAPNKKRGAYDYTDEQITWSWEEIFFAIGKLKERASERDKTPYIPFYPQENTTGDPINNPPYKITC